MTREQAALAEHRLARARDELTTADELRDSGWHMAAASRIYYAAFHSARALLAAAGLQASSHKSAIILFQKHFVRTGRIPAETAKALPRAFEFRQEADYADFVSVSAHIVDEDGPKLRRSSKPAAACCMRCSEGNIPSRLLRFPTRGCERRMPAVWKASRRAPSQCVADQR